MKRGDLLSYARAKYGIRATYQWLPDKDDCFLASPATEQWFAMFTHFHQQSVVDIKCGPLAASQLGINEPFWMKGDQWVGIFLDDHTPEKIVTHLLDLAFQRSLKQAAPPRAHEHLIEVPPFAKQGDYQDQPLPTPPQRFYHSYQEKIPEQIRKMKALYDYTLPSIAGRAKNFYVQGCAMADYEDDFEYAGHVTRYFPTYHDLDTDQLRGYFTWRTKVRQGKIEQTSLSFVYLYIYELLNQIGVADPADGYQRLCSFRQAYQDYADKKLLSYLNQWQQDYVIYYGFDEETIRQQFADQVAEDTAFDTLVNEQEHSAAAVADALKTFSAYQLDHCPLQKKDAGMLDQIIKESWHQLVVTPEKNVVANLLGWQASVAYYPFSSAVFYDQQPHRNSEYRVDPQLIFRCQNGHWQKEYYLPVKRRRQAVGDFMHEIDRLVRQEFQLGRQLKRRPVDDATVTAIQTAITIVRQRVAEARRPKVKIDFGQLAKIREDASVTRESLLTDEERALEAATPAEQPTPAPVSAGDTSEEVPATPTNDFDLTPDEHYLLVHLLRKEPWQAYVKDHHLMVNMLVDAINEKLFDEVGDTVIEFNDANEPQIIEDYQPDLEELFQ